ncbi:hypothetical protein [Candidatus Amarolinea dominans]|uniref:hypothetical protein n=1 Tax=Candidatus Amarolinea dominans TaxID=3140696 RepID=UPI001D603E41|nr:thrombospondin type 3 repeat-containing protein [Anaerolineae bacterium]
MDGRRAATLIQDGAKTFLLRGDSLEEVSNPFSLGTPTTDYLAFVGAADNVRLLDAVQASGETFTRYQFDINGPQMALDMLNEMQRQMQGQLPAGVHLQPPQNLQRMTGSGEIWIDSQGLPRRQVMDLHMPEVDARYDAQTHLVIDFFRFGATSLVPDVVPGPDGGWQLQPLAPAAPRDAAITAPGLHLAAVWAGVRPVVLSPTWLLLFFALLLVVGFVRFYQRSPHRAYGFLAATMIAAMVSGPLLQVLEIVRFQEHMAHAASAEPVVNALGLTLDPASAKSEKPAISVEAEQAMARLLHGQAAPVDEQDTDPLFVACGVGSNTADSDDDGLSDFVENCYGTNYLLADTDFDGVPDGVETTGFEHNGRHWYGNALNGDTNGDGLSDAAAWSQPTGTAPAVDVDGDGIPNLWDGDSDGDGVPNGQDLAPFAVTPSKPAMTLNIADDGFDGYRTIELQIQPQNPAHLRYTLTTLDWPYDEQGQMRDLDGSSQDVRLALPDDRAERCAQSRPARALRGHLFREDD